ncbi:MAG: hypothetical protein KAT09_09250, partial [Candidatus Aegiribacteria sp.]|nr:hypothetical protein [Candidatus Aegiribacteria sp.]
WIFFHLQYFHEEYLDVSYQIEYSAGIDNTGGSPVMSNSSSVSYTTREDSISSGGVIGFRIKWVLFED